MRASSRNPRESAAWQDDWGQSHARGRTVGVRDGAWRTVTAQNTRGPGRVQRRGLSYVVQLAIQPTPISRGAIPSHQGAFHNRLVTTAAARFRPSHTRVVWCRCLPRSQSQAMSGSIIATR